MATAKITGTYTSNNRTMTITKIDTAGNTIGYQDSSTTVLLSTSDNTYSGYGSDTRVINAASAKVALDIDAYGSGVTGHNGALTTVTGGKGADTVTAHGNLTIATGAGKDVIGIGSDTGTITITDYAAGSDAIRFVGKQTAGNKVSDYTAKVAGEARTDGSVKLTIGEDNTAKTVTVKNAADKKITILDTAGNVVNDRPFTRNADLTLTEANSGTVASVNDHIIIDASKKTKATVFTVSGKVGTTPQTLTAGKGNDTVYAGNGLTFTGGKGNDYLVISSDTFTAGQSYSVNFTDYTPGTKDGNGDRIVIGAGYGFSTAYYQNGTAYIAASETSEAANTITINLGTGAVWNQVKPTDGTKNQVLYVTGTTTNGITISDPDLYVEKKLTQAGDLTVNLGSKLTATGDYSKEHISYELTSKALNVTAPLYTDTKLAYATGGSGKDTLAGADSDALVTAIGNSAVGAGANTNITLEGGKGNDLLIGNVSGAVMDGGAGNDTLRSGAKDATVRAAAYSNNFSNNAIMTGGAGNDVFLLTGEGGGTITDYTNTTDKTVKKALGTDKIVIANDKPGAKAVAQSTLSADADENNVSKRYLVDNGDGEEIELTDGKYLTEYNDGTKSVDDSSKSGDNVKSSDQVSGITNLEKKADRIAYDLKLYVDGAGYVDSVAAAQYGTAASDNILTTYTAGGKTATVAGKFVDTTGFGSTYTIQDVAKNTGAKLTVVDQGITYTQDVFTGDITKDSNVTVAANYHGALNPYAEVIDGSKSRKAMRLVGNANTTTLAGGSKADTLIANAGGASLNGGAGNDVFWVNGSSAIIADYGGKTDGTGKEKDKIYGYIPSENVYIGSDTKTLFIDDLQIANGVKYTLNGGINFTDDITYDKVNNKGVITGTTKETHSMIRSFNVGDTIVAAGKGSTDLYIYGDAENDAAQGTAKYGANGAVDSGVMVVDLSKAGKGVNLNVGSSHVVSIKGGAKADTIYGAGNFDSVAFGTAGLATNLKGFSDTSFAGATIATVTTGKGNDVIYNSSIVVADFQAAKATANRTTGAVTKITGDALYFTDASASDVSVASAKLSDNYDDKGHKKQGNDNILVTFDGQDVTVGNVKLAKMKGKQAYIYTGKAADGTTGMGMSELAASNMATLNNLHEFVASNATYGKGRAVITGALGTNATANVYESDVYVIDASAVAGAKIEMGSYVTEVTAGKGVDTIYAGKNLISETTLTASSITAGAGADFIVFDKDSISADSTYFVTDYSADKLVFNGLSIEKGEIGKGTSDTVSVGRGSNAKTYHYSDVTLTVAGVGGDASSKAYVVLQNQLETTGFKITQADSVAAKANAFALTYGQSDVTVAAADGNVIDLQGAGLDNKLNVTVNDKRTKAVTLTGGAQATFGTAAAAYTNILGTASKGAITYIAGTDTGKGVTFYGGNKADMYIGNAQSDVVVFSAGNNTVFGGGMGTSSITFGSGKETAYVKASDTFKVNSYKAGDDVFVLDTVYGAAGGLQGATYTKGASGAKDTLVLTFGTAAGVYGAATSNNAQVVLENYTAGDKVTVKFSTAKGAKIDSSKGLIFQLGFGTDITYADADGTTIDANFVADATKVLAASNVKKSHTLTVGTNDKVTFLQGGAAADTLIANYAVNSLEGGKGNDTFQINSDTATITIADFNTGKDVLQFGSNVAANDFLTGIAKDYNSYYDIDSSNNVTLYYKGATYTTQTVVLKNATATNLVKNGVTTEINIGGTKVKLSDKVNVKLAKTAQIGTDADFAETKTFDGSAATAAITNSSFGTSLTTFKSGKGGATVEFANQGSTAITYTDGGGADKVALGGGKVTFTYNGGADEFTGATASAGNLSVGLASGWSVTGATSVNTINGGSGGANTATFNVKKGNTTSTIKISGGDSVAVFQLGTTAAYKDDSSAEKVGGTVQNSDTTIYTWKKDIYVSGAGFNQVVFKTITSSAKSSDGTKNDKGEGNVTYNFDERYADEYSVITAPETLFGASEFDEITPAKAEVDVSSTSESEVDSVIKGVTATFAGLGKQRQDK